MNIIEIITHYRFINLFMFIIVNSSLLYYFSKIQKKEQLEKDFKILYFLQVLNISFSLIYFILGSYFGDFYKFKIFDDLSHIGTEFIPIFLFFISLQFIPKEHKRIKTKINRKLFYIIPIISIILIFTNDFHNIYYKNYDIFLNNMIPGYGYMINSIYTYFILFLAIKNILLSSINQSGFLSKSSLFIFIGTIVPISINLLGIFDVIEETVFTIPLITDSPAIFFAIAIIKFKALDIIPISLKTIVNTMSDAYIAVSNRGIIIDKNKKFDDFFGTEIKMNLGTNSFDIMKKINPTGLIDIQKNAKKARKLNKVISIEYKSIKQTGKFFTLDIHPIKAICGGTYVGTLLLFKDITKQKKYIEKIKYDQDIIAKQGQLSTIGQLAGGLAHDINTPITTIKTGVEMLNKDLDKEAETQIIYKINNSADKIIKVINSIKNQMRNLNNNEKTNFKISKVINEVKILMYTKAKSNNCSIETNIEDDLTIYGSCSKLVQVLSNLIMNSIIAYNKKGGKIEIIAIKAPKNKILIKVIDYAGGIDPKLKDSIFKELLDFKGSKGTGIGLYLIYSVIRGDFNGEIDFETEQNEGTVFYITLNESKNFNKDV